MKNNPVPPQASARARRACEQAAQRAKDEAWVFWALKAEFIVLGIISPAIPVKVAIGAISGAHSLQYFLGPRADAEQAARRCQEILEKHEPTIQQNRTHGRPLLSQAVHDEMAVIWRTAEKLKQEAAAAHQQYAAAYKAETGQTLLHHFADPLPEAHGQQMANSISSAILNQLRGV